MDAKAAILKSFYCSFSTKHFGIILNLNMTFTSRQLIWHGRMECCMDFGPLPL